MMVNHCRTLLLNRTASYFNGVPGSEYIDPTYAAIPLPEVLQSFRNIIIPNGVDKFVENYIADAVMTLLHQPELEPYVLALDSRITYDVANMSIAEMANPNITLTTTKSSGCDVSFKYIVNQAGIPQVIGQTGRHIWYITKYSSDTVKITGTRTSERLEKVTDPASAYTSRRIPLIAGYLSAYFGMPSGSLTGSFTATYDTLIAAPYNMATQYDQIKNLVGRLSLNLFNDTQYHIPALRTLAMTWANSPESTLRLGCAILAYLLQCDIVFRKTGRGNA